MPAQANLSQQKAEPLRHSALIIVHGPRCVCAVSSQWCMSTISHGFTQASSHVHVCSVYCYILADSVKINNCIYAAHAHAGC